MESEQSNLSQDVSAIQQQPFSNRALSQEARYEPAAVIPLKRGGSLLEWLESNGRLVLREKKEVSRLTPEGNEEELSGLMDDDRNFDDGDSNDDSDDD